MPEPRLLWLVVPTTAPVLTEALVLHSVGFVSAMGWHPQVTAPAPFGMVHDLRWVQAYHGSWWSSGLESVAAIVARGLLTATAVGSASRSSSVWPMPVCGGCWCDFRAQQASATAFGQRPCQ